VGVLVLPQRQPVLLAKQLASLDVLSGGRLTVGVGVGHIEEELRALGATLEHRGAMTDEYIEVVQTLWTGGAQTFAGRWVAFAGVQQSPQPVQRPGPPIIIGGHARAALHRAATVGDGWFGWGLDLQETDRAIAALRQAAASSGREPDQLEITIAPPPPFTLESARQYARLGVHRLVLQPDQFTGSQIDQVIEHAADHLIGRVDR
jgi:probable F420-dependent oxidoreductase